jgi:hypothetical protein
MMLKGRRSVRVHIRNSAKTGKNKPNYSNLPNRSDDDDDDVYLIKITTCGLQNLSPY